VNNASGIVLERSTPATFKKQMKQSGLEVFVASKQN